MNQPLTTSLTHLESSDLVRRLNESELAYWIRHALVQETAQESLLKQERKRLNRLVAETLENLYAERLDEFAVRLFQHYDAAGVDAKTMVYAERAGDVAFRLSAHAEAIAAYKRAFELAQRGEDTTQVIRVMTQLGRAYELDANYDGALAVYRGAQTLAREKNNRALELAALMQLAKVLAVAAMRYDPQQSEKIAREALELARELNDERAQARVLWTMMLLNLYGAGGAKEGVQYGEQSLALARALDWREQMAYTLNDLFYTYLNLGDTMRARAVSQEARALWRELDNKPMLTDNLNASGMDHILRGEFDTACTLAQESRALCVSIGNRWGESTSYMIEGYAHLEHGDFIEARAAFEACMRAGDPIMVHGPIVMARYELAKMYAYLGDTERGLAIAREALERTRNYALDWNAWAYATLAEVEMARGAWDAAEGALREIGDAPPEHFFERMLPAGAVTIVLAQTRRDLRRGDWDAARARLEKMLARVRQSEFEIFLPVTLNQMARVFIANDEIEKARHVLAEAESVAETLNLRAARFEIALTRIELEGEGARERVRNARAELLAYVPMELRDGFLQRVRDDA